MNNQFFIVLPSNSSMDLYPNNKTSSFKVNLSNALMLDSTKWEVALSEIQFQHTWYNIRDGKNIIFKELKHVPHEKKTVGIRTKITIPPGHYSSVDDILTELDKNDYTQKMRRIDYQFNALSRRTLITLPKQSNLDMNGSDIGRCLGFDEKTMLNNVRSDKETSVVSYSIATTENMYKSIYVYMDIIENQYVGDVKVPLLRVIPINSSYGDVSCVKYDKPHFISLNRSNIQTIEVNLMDDAGEFISFEAGKAIVTLVFRRKTAKFFD